MKIGDRILLHNVAFPQNMREGDAPDKFVAVEVTEQRDVPGIFSLNKSITHYGYRAMGDDERFYLCNWDVFPDDSTTPTWMWYREIPNEERAQAIKDNVLTWYDVTQGLPYITFRPIWLDRYEYIVKWCPKHSNLYYDECFYCEHSIDTHVAPIDARWNGWK